MGRLVGRCCVCCPYAGYLHRIDKKIPARGRENRRQECRLTLNHVRINIGAKLWKKKITTLVNWDEAPKWAHWWAVSNGLAYWYANEPTWMPGEQIFSYYGLYAPDRYIGFTEFSGPITLQQRPKIITGPDWSKAPEWARWWAVDEDGISCWYEEQPDWNGSCFRSIGTIASDGKHKNHPHGPVSFLENITAGTILHNAKQHIDDRARQYDSPGGERSMDATVNAFNLITGHKLTETDGWQFMEILKIVRSRSGKFKADNYEDAAAYAALAGESASRESKA